MVNSQPTFKRRRTQLVVVDRNPKKVKPIFEKPKPEIDNNEYQTFPSSLGMIAKITV